MSLSHWRIRLGLAACVLALAGAGRAVAQDSSHKEGRDHKSHEHQLYHNLTSVHNYGATLYNNGDWAGCCRLFEGSLMTLRPMLAHHPELQKSVEDALALAQANPSMVDRAWILREALLKVRKVHAPEKGSAGKTEDHPKPKTEDHPKPKIDDHPKPKIEEPPPVTKRTLWDRLGGEKGVSRIVDDIVTTAARDPKVNFFRGGKVKLDAAGMKRFKQHMVQEASALTGGPLHYQGEDMKKAHKGMGITNSEFDAFMGHVKDALEKNNVNPTDAATILTTLGGKRKDIVEAKKPDDKKTGDGTEDRKPEDHKPADKKNGDKNGDKKTGDKKNGDKKTTNPFEPKTDKKPSTDKPADKKPAEIKEGQQGHVSGKVTFQGRPLSKGEVVFHPATGKSTSAPIKGEGNFSIDILPGDYVVSIKEDKDQVPDSFKDKKTSPLRVNVKTGKQVHDLELTR